MSLRMAHIILFAYVVYREYRMTTHGQNNYIALDPIANGYSGGGGALAVCLDYPDLWIRNDITAQCT